VHELEANDSLPKEIHEQIIVTLHHTQLYADKVKDIKKPTRLITKSITCNTTVSFTDDDLLLGSKPHNHPFFVTAIS